MAGEGPSIEIGQINGIHMHLTELEFIVRYFICNFKYHICLEKYCQGSVPIKRLKKKIHTLADLFS